MSDIDYRFDLRTSVGQIFPWFGKMLETLNPINTDGFVDIHFDHDGIRIETHNGDRHIISEETIPATQLGALASIYEEYRYQAFQSRRLRYYDLEDIQSWLSEFPPEQPITLRIEYDEKDVAIRLGGIMKYFGYSDIRRPGCVVLNSEA